MSTSASCRGCGEVDRPLDIVVVPEQVAVFRSPPERRPSSVMDQICANNVSSCLSAWRCDQSLICLGYLTTHTNTGAVSLHTSYLYRGKRHLTIFTIFHESDDLLYISPKDERQEKDTMKRSYDYSFVQLDDNCNVQSIPTHSLRQNSATPATHPFFTPGHFVVGPLAGPSGSYMYESPEYNAAQRLIQDHLPGEGDFDLQSNVWYHPTSAQERNQA